jgi:hypothetical protein
MDSLYLELGLKDIQEWCRVSPLTIIERGGGPLLSLYGSSLRTALLSIYPNVTFHAWSSPDGTFNLSLFIPCFKPSSSSTAKALYGMWSDEEYQRNYFDWLAEKLQVNSVDDWYRVQFEDFVENSGGGILKRFGNSFTEALAIIYPFTEWLMWKFDQVKIQSIIIKLYDKVFRLASKALLE